MLLDAFLPVSNISIFKEGAKKVTFKATHIYK